MLGKGLNWRETLAARFFKPEQPRERALREAIFEGGGIPNLIVPLNQNWRLHPDFHPDARAHDVMAQTLWLRSKNKLKANSGNARQTVADTRWRGVRFS